MVNIDKMFITKKAHPYKPLINAIRMIRKQPLPTLRYEAIVALQVLLVEEVWRINQVLNDSKEYYEFLVMDESHQEQVIKVLSYCIIKSADSSIIYSLKSIKHLISDHLLRRHEMSYFYQLFCTAVEFIIDDIS